ncbi:MAG: hypothetical protein MOB07_11770 [Acidobacteria bacterium]|nr:hypothetical protein [Acidobacteriota bacterium]
MRIADCGLKIGPRSPFRPQDRKMADRKMADRKMADRKMADRKTEKWHFLFFCLPFFCQLGVGGQLDDQRRRLFSAPILDPRSSIRNPQSAIRNPQSAIRNPQSAIRNPQSAIRNPQSALCASERMRLV